MKPNELDCPLTAHRYKHRPDKSVKNSRGKQVFYECLACSGAYACVEKYRDPKGITEKLRNWVLNERITTKTVHNCPDKEVCLL